MLYLYYLLTYCALVFSTQNNAIKNSIITPKDGWFISSPLITPDTTLRGSPRVDTDTSPITFLKSIGEQAHETWLNSHHSNETLVALEKLFQPVDRDFLYDLIEESLNDEKLLETVTKASYRNVTGFLKVVLVNGPNQDSWKIRLHVWEQKEQKEFPHNHKWDFYSKIISGYLQQDIYTKDESSCDTAQAHSVREPVSLMPIAESGVLPCPCRDNYILNPKNSGASIVALRHHTTDIIGNGESYLMPYDLIHTITPGRGSVSLVFTSDKVTDNSDVFVPMEIVNNDLTRYAPSVTTEELKIELRRVQKLLRQLYVHEKYLPEMVNNDHEYYHINRNDVIKSSPHWRKALHSLPDRKIVSQLSKEEAAAYIVKADAEGKLVISNQPIDPSHDYLFVLFNNVMYANPKDFHHERKTLICHTSFSDYGPVDAAGLLRFDAQGNLTTIEAYSGHYCPDLKDMVFAKEHLDTMGVNTNQALLTTYQDRPVPQ